MPHASTFTRTIPALGSGISRSTNSHSPRAFPTCAAFILVATVAPVRYAWGATLGGVSPPPMLHLRDCPRRLVGTRAGPSESRQSLIDFPACLRPYG